MASAVVFFLLFLLPFVIAPFGVTQFENPKVIGAEIGVILLLLISLFSNNFSFLRRKEQILLFGCIGFITCIDLLFFETTISFFGNSFRMQGIFLLWVLLLFSFFSRPVSFKKMTKSWVFFLLLLVELIALFLLPLNASHRYVGTLGEPNALAGFVVFLWPFVWFGSGGKKLENIIISALSVLIVIAILLLSGSRSGMIAFGTQMAFIITKFAVSRFTRERSIKIAVMICLGLYIVSYTLPFFEQVPYENRVEVWESALFAGVINPAFGQGFGNTEIALHNSAAGLNLPIQYYYVDSSHNIFLDWWVQAGMIGLSILLLLVYGCFKNFTQTQNLRELVLLLGVLTVLSFNPASVVELLAFWWLIGQSFA